MILLLDELIENEIKDALLYIASTTPRVDIVIIDVIKVGWVALKTLIITLYRASIRLGYYLKAFKGFYIVMIPKGGKWDLIDVSS